MVLQNTRPSLPANSSPKEDVSPFICQHLFRGEAAHKKIGHALNPRLCESCAVNRVPIGNSSRPRLFPSAVPIEQNTKVPDLYQNTNDDCLELTRISAFHRLVIQCPCRMATYFGAHASDAFCEFNRASEWAIFHTLQPCDNPIL